MLFFDVRRCFLLQMRGGGPVPEENEKRFFHGRKRRRPINYTVIGELLRKNVNRGNVQNLSENGPFGCVLRSMNRKNSKRAHLQLKNMWLRNSGNVQGDRNAASLATEQVMPIGDEFNPFDSGSHQPGAVQLDVLPSRDDQPGVIRFAGHRSVAAQSGVLQPCSVQSDVLPSRDDQPGVIRFAGHLSGAVRSGSAQLAIEQLSSHKSDVDVFDAPKMESPKFNSSKSDVVSRINDYADVLGTKIEGDFFNYQLPATTSFTMCKDDWDFL